MDLEPAFEEINYLARGDVRVVRFARPESRNCVGPTTHRELVEAWMRFRDDETARVAVVTGAGGQAFCSGGDLKAAGGIVPSDPDEIAAHVRGERAGFLGPTRWTDFDRPILAAINGVAYAGGLEWACFADLRIAEEHATFGVTCRRWNVGLGDGGTQRLPRIVGLGRAMELILTGRVIDAQEAERIGLVNEVVARGRSLARALQLADFLCSLPQPAMRSDKRAAIGGLHRSLDDGLQFEAECFFTSIHQPETAEGLRRFRERDHPDRRHGDTPRTPGLPLRSASDDPD
ncbi:MAG: enoyl-CoA hydratase-related protein [Acidobacteriota bacterium]